MRRNRRWMIRAGTWLGLFVVLLTPAGATMMVRMDDASLVLGSDVILSGIVADVKSGRGDGGEIHTYITLMVDDVLKGYVPQAAITIREPGGRVGDEELRLFGTPRFEVGETTIVFLDQDDHGFLRTHQMALGKFDIAVDRTGQAVATRRLDDVGVLALGNAALQSHAADDRRPAAAFKTRLRELVRSQPVPQPMRPLTGRPAATTTNGQQTTTAFTLSNNVRWFEPDDGTPIRYWIDRVGDARLGPAASEAAMRAAFAAWTNVPSSSLVLETAGLTDATPDTFCDGINKIIFDDPYDQVTDPTGCSGILAVGGYCVGLSFRTINGVTFRQATEGDLVFNDGWTDCPAWNATNVAEVATHELGHTIGLGHSTDETATMRMFAHFDGRGATLRPDDEAGVSFIYPGADSDGTTTPEPTPTVGPTPAPPDADGDGIASELDNCPTTRNPTQTDIDHDGVGDACDNCVAGANAEQHPADACEQFSLKSLRISLGRAAAGDRLAVRGRIDATTIGASLSAIAGQPVRMVLSNALGQAVLDVTIPPGQWKSNRRSTRLQVSDRTGASLGGLTRVTLRAKRNARIDISAAAKKLDLRDSIGPELSMALELAGESYLSIDACKANRKATRLRCP